MLHSFSTFTVSIVESIIVYQNRTYSFFFLITFHRLATILVTHNIVRLDTWGEKRESERNLV